MVEPMTLCAFLFSTMITGAYEYRPGIMHVELLNTQTETIEELYVYTEDYIQCWDNGVPVLPECLDLLIAEEQALPPIPDFPSIYTTNETIHRLSRPDGDHKSL